MDEIIDNPQQSTKNRSSMVKILTPIFVVIFIIILIVVKNQNPDFPIGYIILIGTIILVIGGIAFFGLEITNKLNILKRNEIKRNSLPAPAEISVLWACAMNSLTNPIYRDHIKEYVQTINHSVGKNMKSLVVEFQIYSIYRPKQLCSILINANYPKRLPTVIFNSDKKTYQLRSAIQSMSFDPEDPADEEETTVRNDITGMVSTTKRKTYTSKKSNEPIKKEAII